MYRQANKNMSSAQLGIFCVCLEIVYNTKVEGLWLFIKNKKFQKIYKKNIFLKKYYYT